MGRPSFSPPLKSKGYMCIGDEVRLADFFPTPLNHMHNSFPLPNNLLNKVDV